MDMIRREQGGQIVIRENKERTHFRIGNNHCQFQCKGADDSKTTKKALEIAKIIAKQKVRNLWDES